MEYRAEGEERSEHVKDWDPDEIVKHAAKVSIKEKIYQKAGQNITRAQKKDKEYYDKKHSDPRCFTK